MSETTAEQALFGLYWTGDRSPSYCGKYRDVISYVERTFPSNINGKDFRILEVPPAATPTPTLSPIATAFRDGLLKCLEEPFNNAMLSKLMRMAEAARDWLRAEAPKPEDFKHGMDVLGTPSDDSQLTPLGIQAAVAGSGLNAETFGARMLRELLPQLKELSNRQTADQLVMAISTARSSGMYEIAAKLEEKLTGEAATPEKIEKIRKTEEEKNAAALYPGLGGVQPGSVFGRGLLGLIDNEDHPQPADPVVVISGDARARIDARVKEIGDAEGKEAVAAAKNLGELGRAISESTPPEPVQAKDSAGYPVPGKPS